MKKYIERILCSVPLCLVWMIPRVLWCARTKRERQELLTVVLMYVLLDVAAKSLRR